MIGAANRPCGERPSMKVTPLVGVVLLSLSASVIAAEPPPTDWPGWRGPRADGVAEGRNLPVRWSATENVRWSVELPGWGTSSPVVFGDRVFVTSHRQDKKSLLTLCLDRATGKERWRHDF